MDWHKICKKFIFISPFFLMIIPRCIKTFACMFTLVEYTYLLGSLYFSCVKYLCLEKMKRFGEMIKRCF